MFLVFRWILDADRQIIQSMRTKGLIPFFTNIRSDASIFVRKWLQTLCKGHTKRPLFSRICIGTHIET